MGDEAGFANHKKPEPAKNTNRVECGIFFSEKYEALDFCLTIFLVSACCSQFHKNKTFI